MCYITFFYAAKHHLQHHPLLTFTSVGLLPHSRSPWQVIVEVLTLFTVESLGVVGALAAAVHHPRLVLHAGQGQAAGGMAVAGAGPPHYHVIDGIIVFFLQVVATGKWW